MTSYEIKEALQRVCDHCDDLMGIYESVSMRDALKFLNYTTPQANEIINHCAMNGFDYCLDYTIPATHFDPNNPAAVNGMVTDYPEQQFCSWGPDQLKSRVRCVRVD